MIRRLSLITLATVILIVGTLISLTISTPALSAPQHLNVEPNGHVTFFVSIKGVTRVGVMDDRIRNIIADDSAFEMSNDEKTGDVFFRLLGTREAKPENGYIITDSGVTIGYTMIPKNSVVGAALISVAGNGAKAAGTSSISTVGGFSDDIALTMTEIVRAVAQENVFGRIPSGKKNKVLKTVKHGNWVARVIVVTGGKAGRLVSEQDFAKGARAVWVQNKSLAPNESTFVIVVGEK